MGLEALVRREAANRLAAMGGSDPAGLLDQEPVTYFDGFARCISGALTADFGSGMPSASIVSASSWPVAGILFTS